MSATAAAAAAPAPAAAAKRVVTFVTGNKNKLIETQACFGDSVTLKAVALDRQSTGSMATSPGQPS